MNYEIKERKEADALQNADDVNEQISWKIAKLKFQYKDKSFWKTFSVVHLLPFTLISQMWLCPIYLDKRDEQNCKGSTFLNQACSFWVVLNQADICAYLKTTCYDTNILKINYLIFESLLVYCLWICWSSCRSVHKFSE